MGTRVRNNGGGQVTSETKGKHRFQEKGYTKWTKNQIRR